MISKIKHIHMIGIGGSGMSGIAEVLLNLDFNVTGSDVSNGAPVQRLRGLGATVSIGHAEENIGDAQVVVRSTAISDDNPEIVAATEKGIPIIPRAEMLAELMRLRLGIAIAGTHGKTTTTSLTAAIFDEANTDPTVIIGGRLNAYGANARLGAGEFLIAEADESDGSFLCLFPIITVVTNVDCDHLDFYSGQEDIDSAFIQFMNSVPFYGANVVCGDDKGVQRLIPQVKRRVITYGFEEGNDIRAIEKCCAEKSEFTVVVDGKEIGDVVLSQPGRHNILNALGAIGVAIESGISAEKCISGLTGFNGVGRRFERKGERNGVLVIDDYGHHPVEVAATIRTARQCFPERRLVVAFQPHRFSRTQALFGQFCIAFEGVDKLLLTEIYPASESPIPGINGESLAHGIRQASSTKVEYCEDFEAVSAKLPDELQDGDIFITLGAGNIWTVGQGYLDGAS
ncbi:UDP-N-acetylmuramate--L-alanine ligase [Halodesulfovibrio marinisediminis]|uniref:UDP-N-acetylmuramate--L-alanine ligase n=1 Tax=Halodesulfovibrio marinisediminis DSM 17456 TaxID=1121457 RepID=A0A1N6HIZ3_9BACT|nr:UDP-N-acetylmuramate--L-alanine ligase [Halodesulfovibrio marinisediminis]SIO19828.1 UDP-N-acetylmuramate--L-alanine ligase [Halodesulfovibrio marinisediminis DSM 17456]